MIIVTGGCGFIGSNIVKHLNDRGIKDILVVDNLTNGHKFMNLTDLDIADYMDKEDFMKLVLDEKAFDSKYGCKNIQAIFHEGACSATTEWNGKYIMKNNYEYTVNLLSLQLLTEFLSSLPHLHQPTVTAMFSLKTEAMKVR